MVDVAHVELDPDDGFTSLREALVQAKANPGPDTITFHPDLPYESIRNPNGGFLIGTIIVASGQPASNGELVVDSDVTIDASGLGLLRIGHSSTELLHRVFRITEGANVMMKNVIVQGGRTDLQDGGQGLGAGIYNDGSLTLIDSIVGANTQYSERGIGGKLGGGAGIYNSGTGHLTLRNTHVGALTIDNSVYEDLGLDLPDEGLTSQIFVRGNIAQGIGGGIFNEGVLRVTDDSSLVFNQSNYSGAGIYNAGTTTITDSVLDGNEALGDSAAGAGIKNSVRIDSHASRQTGLVDGWETPSGPVSLTIERSQILNHEAGLGAGILSNAPLVIEETVFANNHVTNRGLADMAVGGAIAIEQPSSARKGHPIDTNISRSLFRNNSAAGNGGAIATFADRQARLAYTLTVAESTFVGNSVGSPGVRCSRLDARGCGAAVSIDTAGYGEVTTTILSSTFANNEASLTAGRSTATYFANGGTTRIYNSVFSKLPSQSAYDLQVLDRGQFESLGYNVVDRTRLNGASLADTDLVTSTAGLGPLGHYGGPTQTVGLLPSSPALNSGPVSLAEGALDQRGQPRLVGPAADRGAFESTPLLRMEVDSLSDVADGYYAPERYHSETSWHGRIQFQDTTRFASAKRCWIRSRAILTAAQPSHSARSSTSRMTSPFSVRGQRSYHSAAIS